MTTIAFTDTETTSLRPDRRAWEIGIILREAGKTDTEHRWLIAAEDLDLGNADLMSLKIGRFYERHPEVMPLASGPWPAVTRENVAMAEVEEVTRGAHLVGAVVSFDADVLGQRMRAHGICPSWHYHIIDCEALAVGYLAHAAAVCERREPGEYPGPERGTELRELAAPPWKSDDLADVLGITVSEEERHTALGDARWARAIFDAVTGGRP